MSEIQKQIQHGKTRGELDAFAFSHISKKWLEFERPLFRVKWFDYRFLHPVESSMLYAEEFGKAYRRFFAQVVDHERADNISVPDAKKFIEGLERYKSQRTGCWRGRQIADALGMPYGVFINESLKDRLKYWKQIQLPRPQQLYSEVIVNKMSDLWKKQQEIKLYFSELPNFTNQNYHEYSWQNDHHEWLFEQANMRGNPLHYLAVFMQNGLLPDAKIRARIGDEVSEKPAH